MLQPGFSGALQILKALLQHEKTSSIAGGRSLLECPDRNAIFSRYPLKEITPEEFSDFCDNLVRHAYNRTSNEENLVGLVYREDRVSGRSPSATTIETEHLNMPLSVSGDTLPSCGMLCVRHPLPAVVFSDKRPPQGFIRVADTRALGFSMPLWFYPQTIDETGDGTWMLTGIFYIPEGPHIKPQSWLKVIPNSVCSREGMTLQGRRGAVNLMFEWNIDGIKTKSVRLSLAHKILTSLMGVFGGRRN
ncbi:hypothetical protein JNO12_24370 [Erwinia aphidicola]|nr:hypothetical protein [Erwinia aphidicola]